MSSARDELHRLADELPEELAGAVVNFAEKLQERRRREQLPADYLRALAILEACPVDDEPFTEEERAEILAAREEYRQHGGIRLEDVMAELDS